MEHDIQSINLRRQRRVPRRHFERSEDYIQTSAEDEYRMDFFKVIDTACALLKDNFISTDLREYQATTDFLFEQELEQNTISKYPELSASLKEELFFSESSSLALYFGRHPPGISYYVTKCSTNVSGSRKTVKTRYPFFSQFLQR